MTTTISCDLNEQIAKHQEAIDEYNKALPEIGKRLLLNKMLAIYAVSGHPEHTEDVERLRDIGEKRANDVANRIRFHQLMIMLFNTFRAVINGRSEQRVLGLVAEKVKEAIHDVLAGVEDLIPYGKDFYTEEEYLQISKGLMAEYKAWSPLCDPTASTMIVPVD